MVRGERPIKQYAALPYRIRDGAIEVMLITSRGTGRWVIPKGNPIAGLTGHQTAAREAYEEAGIVGAVCPVALGRYRYDKKRDDGSVRQARVRVYPLAFERQLAHWPEEDQRDQAWYAPRVAARLVDEPELARMIRDLRTPPPGAFPGFGPLLRLRQRWQGRLARMRWFRSLLPQDGRFFDLFEAHAATLVAGADALARLLAGGSGVGAAIRLIHDEEHKADDITRDVLLDVRRTFVTPFDRSAITSLIGVMDDAIDQMNTTAKLVELYGFTSFDDAMRDVGAIIVEAARIISDAVPLLRAVGSNVGRLNELTERIVKLEGRADDIHDTALKALLASSTASGEPMRFIAGRDFYDSLEKVADKFEDVANEIQGLVIDHV